MKVVLLGAGATGSRAARHVAGFPDLSSLTIIDDDLTIAEEVALSLGQPAEALSINAVRLETRVERFTEACSGADLAIVTAPGDHRAMVTAALQAGAHVVSTSDDLDTVDELLELDAEAQARSRSVIVGAGFSPGLTCLLARHAGLTLDVIDEVHIAKFGTGGPACARQHHRALRTDGIDWRNQQWEKRRGGSGRELCWFPDPVGGLDCYQAALPEPRLTLAGFPQAVRITARVAATRRDRSTKWLPMLRRPHPEGTIGAVRVEVRGWRGSLRDSVIFGALDRPAVAAGTVAAVAGLWATGQRYRRFGAGGLSELVDDTLPVLRKLEDLGVKAAVFEGVPHD